MLIPLWLLGYLPSIVQRRYGHRYPMILISREKAAGSAQPFDIRWLQCDYPEALHDPETIICGPAVIQLTEEPYLFFVMLPETEMRVREILDNISKMTFKSICNLLT